MLAVKISCGHAGQLADFCISGAIKQRCQRNLQLALDFLQMAFCCNLYLVVNRWFGAVELTHRLHALKYWLRLCSRPVGLRKNRSEEHTSELQSRGHLV